MKNATTNTQTPETAKGSLTVLVVEDHPYFRKSLVSYLAEFSSVNVVGKAADGMEALELAERLRPQLVVMDIQMPEMDGLDACKLIKIKYPGTRVILYSMHASETFSKESLSCADGFVTKDRLFEELNEIIGQSKALASKAS